jgi:hypothetical protein
VALSRDGKTVATAQADASVLVWDGEFLKLSTPMGQRNFSIGHIDQR